MRYKLHKFNWTLGHWGKSAIMPDGEIHTWNLDEDDRTHSQMLFDNGVLVYAGQNCCLIAPSGACVVAPAWEGKKHWTQHYQDVLYRLERHLFYDADHYWREFIKRIGKAA